MFIYSQHYANHWKFGVLEEFLNDDSGASAIEYAFISALISIAILAAVTNLGDSVDRA